MRLVLREFLYFTVIFILLSLSVHMDRWLSAPLSHIEHLSSHVLPIHPLVYSAIAYVVFFILRSLFRFIRRIFNV